MRGLHRRLAGTASLRPIKLGIAFYVALAVVLAMLAFKTPIKTTVSGGRTFTAEFAGSYKLRAYDSGVKIGGIEVGTVTGIERDDHTVRVTMKIDDESYALLGAHPIARVEPRTILGGRYAVEIHPSGSGTFSGNIPVQDTADPTELDRVLEALPATTRQALRGLVEELGPTLTRVDPSLGQIAAQAPPTLRRGATFLAAARGTRPGVDLPAAIRGLERAAGVLTARSGQLGTIVNDLDTTAAVLAAHRSALSQTIANLPSTLREAGPGLAGLSVSIDRLQGTARALRPSAPTVTDLVNELAPALAEARPVLADLKPLLRSLRPTVQQLVPTITNASSVLGDLDGPVLARLNGPVTRFVLDPWKGSGPYAASAQGYQADHRFYEELAYMATNIDRASMEQDQYGATLAFQAGAGDSTLTDGLPGAVPFSAANVIRMALDAAGITNPLTRHAALVKAGVLR